MVPRKAVSEIVHVSQKAFVVLPRLKQKAGKARLLHTFRIAGRKIPVHAVHDGGCAGSYFRNNITISSNCFRTTKGKKKSLAKFKNSLEFFHKVYLNYVVAHELGHACDPNLHRSTNAEAEVAADLFAIEHALVPVLVPPGKPFDQDAMKRSLRTFVGKRRCRALGRRLTILLGRLSRSKRYKPMTKKRLFEAKAWIKVARWIHSARRLSQEKRRTSAELSRAPRRSRTIKPSSLRRRSR